MIERFDAWLARWLPWSALLVVSVAAAVIVGGMVLVDALTPVQAVTP